MTNTNVIKSPLDTKQYKRITLDNGLQALLISDKTAKLAAASLSVGSGSTSETGNFYGIAHYLEHMLFLGSKKFPKADNFMEFVSQNGGSYNAYTASDETNFFFSIHPDAMASALDRFSDFFIAPLLTPEFMQREQQAVHAEFTSKLQDENRRNLDALRETFNNKNPISRFSAGNAESLPISDQLRTELIQFYQENYFAENMSIVILAPYDLETTQNMLEKYFYNLPRGEKKQLVSTSLFADETLPAKLEIKPLQELYKMQLYFPSKNPELVYRQKPDYYLSHLIADEGEGSVLQFLKQQGWATGLFAGDSFLKYRDLSLFTIQVELTKQGYENSDKVKALIFAYIDLIKAKGIELWRFEELQKLSEADWNYNEGENPLNLVMALASDLRKVADADILKARYIFADYDANLISEFLHNLAPNNCMEVIVAPNVTTNKTSKWLNTPYALNTKLNEELANITDLIEYLQLPEPNIYVAEQKIVAQTKQVPEKRFESDNLVIWSAQDSSFNTPKIFYKFKFESKLACKNSKNYASLKLLIHWLSQTSSKIRYPAYLASLQAVFRVDKKGFSLSLQGLSAKSGYLLTQLLQYLKHGQIEPEKFVELKQDMARKIANKKFDTLYKQVFEKFHDDIMPPKFSDSDLIDNLRKLNLADFERFRRELLLSSKITSFLYGNIDEIVYIDIKNRLEDFISLGTKADYAPIETQAIEKGIYTLDCKIENPDKCLVYYIQGKDADIATRAKFALLVKLQDAEFFYQLRTLQQLGYIVMNANHPLPDYAGIVYLVQSPNTSVEKIFQAVTKFLQDDLARLKNLNQTDYVLFKQGLTNELLKPDDNLYKTAHRYWDNLFYKREMKDYRSELVHAVEQLTLTDMLKFYEEIIGDHSAKLVVSAGDKPLNLSKVQYTRT